MIAVNGSSWVRRSGYFRGGAVSMSRVSTASYDSTAFARPALARTAESYRHAAAHRLARTRALVGRDARNVARRSGVSHYVTAAP